jgi:hypothetical protein
MNYKLLELFVKGKLEHKFDDFLFNGGKGGFTFESKYENRILTFGCSISDYADVQKLNGLNANITFLEVEKIVTPILVKNKLLGESVLENYQPTIGIIIQNSESLNLEYAQKEIDIKVDEDAKELTAIIEMFYIKEVIPFFNTWNNLSVLRDYINNTEEDQLWDILGTLMPFKKAVILKLCNDPNYQSYMDDYFNEQKSYFEEDAQDTDNVRYYNASKELKKVLDDISPI